MKVDNLTIVVSIILMFAVFSIPVISTFGHSSIGINRQTNQNVTSNDTGILGINEQHQTIKEGENKSLVNTTNNLNTQQNVTVELSNDVSKWSLSNGEQSKSTILSGGQQTTYYVSVSEVDSEVNATYYVKSQTDNFWFEQKRTVNIKPAPRTLVSANSTDILQLVRENSVNTLSKTGQAVSPITTDFDSDGRKEFAYTNGSSDLTFIDKQNETKTIQTTAKTTKTRYWAGNWSTFDDGAFYTNSSDQNIYHATYSGNITLVSDAKSSAILGKGDIDNDGTDELVFSGGSQEIKYLEPDVSGDGDSTPQVKKVGVGAGANNGIGIGSPANFNESGTARIPYVDGSNQLMLTTQNGTTTTITNGGAEKTSLAPNDWDYDGQPEIMFVDKSSHALKMADLESGSWTITTVSDSNGDKIIISPSTGVA